MFRNFRTMRFSRHQIQYRRVTWQPPVLAFWILFLFSNLLAQPNGLAADLEKLIKKADALEEKGQNSAARDLYVRALAALRAGPPTAQLGHVLSVLSDIELSDGKYDSSVKAAQEAADVYRSIGDTHAEAGAQIQKGIADVQRGSFADGEADYQTALQLTRKAQAPDLEVQLLNNLGGLFYLRGEYHVTLSSYEQALQILDRSSDAKWARYWRQITNFNEATLYQRLGRYQKALEIYREVQNHPTGFSPGDRAHVLANLGTLYRRLGDPFKALTMYRAAQALYSTAHDADGEISVLKNIGIVYALDERDYARAASTFRTVQSLAYKTENRREEMQTHLYLGETLIRAKSLQPANEEFETALSLAQQLGTTEEQWKADYGLGRIAEAVGNSPGAEKYYRDGIDIIESTRSQLQQTSLRAEFLADKRDVYDSLISILLARSDVPSAFAFIERSRARTFQDRILGSENLTNGFLSLDEVRSRLNSTELLLELWTSGERVALFWFRKDGFGVIEKSFASEQQEHLQKLIDQMSSGKLADWRPSLRELSAILPQENDAAWRDAKQILVVPDGWLSSVPFEMLPTSASGQLLIERFAVTYLPSAILLRRPDPPTLRLRGPWTTELIAFGNPVIRSDVFAPAISTSAQGSESPAALPGSTVEIQGIAKMVPGVTRAFLGGDNLKSTFLSQANNAPLLHVSTHAFADVNNPENSRILFTSRDPNTPADYVFLRELDSLALDRVRLATISACDTERGAIIRGEGVQSFSRSLLSAGARASLTSLWRVDDAATAEFMQQFYFFALRKHEPVAEALRDAKITFLHSARWQHPRYWAAFVLNGERDERAPAIFSWAQLILTCVALAALLFAVAGYFTLWRRRGGDRKHHAGGIVAH
jgi:CHAT domain-containing protein